MAVQTLNLFQRLVRRWEAVHPYNAAQFVRVAGRFDPERAEAAWNQTLRTLGLGQVRTADRLHYVHAGRTEPDRIRVLADDGSLESHLSSELNRSFDSDDGAVFRPFLVSEPEESRLGVVYRHWLADSVSVRAVLREWLIRLIEPAAARTTPMRRSDAGYWRLFASRGDWRLDEALLASFRSHMRHRRVRKIRGVGPADRAVRVSLHRAPDRLIDGLRRAARARGCKVHDILLAAVAEVCARFVPTQVRKKRPDLSVGAIVDLRPYATADLRDTFGLYLGFTQVICTPRTLDDWPRLLRSVAAQNRAAKRSGLPQASLFWMAAAIAMNPLVPDRNLYRFYRKELPTSGGLSNVNWNEPWATERHPALIREYWRISPTGPLVPLVFATTTLGSTLTIALTCRDNLLPKTTAAEMVRSFLDRLQTAAE